MLSTVDISISKNPKDYYKKQMMVSLKKKEKIRHIVDGKIYYALYIIKNKNYSHFVRINDGKKFRSLSSFSKDNIKISRNKITDEGKILKKRNIESDGLECEIEIDGEFINIKNYLDSEIEKYGYCKKIIINQ